MDEMTTIWIKKSTKTRFVSLGNMKETEDALLNRILDIFELKRVDEIIGKK